MCHPFFTAQLFLTSRRPFSITFTRKSYLRSETHLAYEFYTQYPQTAYFSEGKFCSCVENVIHVLDPFFFRSSHGVDLLFTKSISMSYLPQNVLHLKIKLKF